MSAAPVKVGLAKIQKTPPKAMKTRMHMAIVFRASERTSRKSKRSKPLRSARTLEYSCSPCSNVSITRLMVVYQHNAALQGIFRRPPHPPLWLDSPRSRHIPKKSVQIQGDRMPIIKLGKPPRRDWSVV